ALNHFAGPIFYTQARACIGICHPRGAVLSRLCPYGIERTEGTFRGARATALCGLCRNRRISSVFRSITNGVTARRNDRHLWRNVGGNPVLVDRNTSHNSKPLVISAPKQGALAFDRGRKGGMPVWRTTGRSAFRDMPDMAGQ